MIISLAPMGVFALGASTLDPPLGPPSTAAEFLVYVSDSEEYIKFTPKCIIVGAKGVCQNCFKGAILIFWLLTAAFKI